MLLDVRIPNVPLAPCAFDELVPASGRVARVEMDGAIATADERSLFVSIEADCSDVEIDTLTYERYQRLLRGVERAGYPNVVRIWNFVPRIHDKTSEIDRYMLFCRGRSEAFAAHYGNDFAGRLPAASALGCPGNRLVVHALASRDPVRHIENPRQVSAYRYPGQFGPKSPTFARGTVALGALNGAVFVSGTASIVGYESVFPGDPARQTEETMRNIEAVLDACGVPGRGEALGSRLVSLRVYVRFPDQLGAIREALRERAGTTVPTSWFQAEICREELLVEIEGTARTATV